MTDKEIIIDDVDISGCEYCLKMTKYRCTIQRDVYKCLCEENPNCHYKQLKRKEQEVKELKEQLSIEQERYTTIRPHAIELADTKLKLQKEVNKYKQIFDEIKEDISEYIKTPDFFEELDSNSAITRDEYIAICTRHNLASEINNIVKKCDKKE